MKSLRLLLQTLVRFWDIREEDFIIQEQHIDVMLLDMYFLTRVSMLGVIGNLMLVLSHEETLEDLCDRHCYTTAYVHGSHILMCDIEELSTWAVATMVLHILGSLGNHKISGVQIQMVMCALRALITDGLRCTCLGFGVC